MWESSEPCSRVEPSSGIRCEAEYATTRIPKAAESDTSGTGRGAVTRSHACVCRRNDRNTAEQICIAVGA